MAKSMVGMRSRRGPKLDEGEDRTRVFYTPFFVLDRTFSFIVEDGVRLGLCAVQRLYRLWYYSVGVNMILATTKEAFTVSSEPLKYSFRFAWSHPAFQGFFAALYKSKSEVVPVRRLAAF